MRPNWKRLQRACVGLSYGAITLGILQAFEMVNFAQIFTQFLTFWLSLIATALFGGDVSSLIASA